MDLRIFTEPQQGASYDELLAMARRTEECGFSAFFRSDHYLAMGGDGLPAWTARDRTVENTDIVLWHSFGLHHLPRPEDHPVQPCVVCGFKLLPYGFFDQNPVIDLPRTTNAKSSCCG